jgi:hypothetical protein
VDLAREATDVLILTQAAQVERTHTVRLESEVIAQNDSVPRRDAPAVTHCHMLRAGVTAWGTGAPPGP